MDIKKTIEDISDIYTQLYDGPVTEHKYSVVDLGDLLLRARPELVKAIAKERGDAFTSDREIAALAIAVALNA